MCGRIAAGGRPELLKLSRDPARPPRTARPRYSRPLHAPADQCPKTMPEQVSSLHESLEGRLTDRLNSAPKKIQFLNPRRARHFNAC